MKKVDGQVSYIFGDNQTEIALTKLGGHMAPVTFFKNSKSPITPYYISPWQNENLSIDEPVLRPLRGDFFCMPFGGNNKLPKEKHVAHGESATSEWEFVNISTENDVITLETKLTTKVRPGTITKRLSIKSGESVIYCQHVLDGYSGKMPLGHHATLQVPDEPGSILFSSNPIRFGYTSPGSLAPYANREYYCLPPGKKFKDLSKVPTIWKDKPFTDKSTFPSDEGFTDIVAIFPKESTGIGWNCAVYPKLGYVWFALKDRAILNSTVLWMANKGRHGSPWNGRNRCLGLEDVCAFFAEGLVDSIKDNFLSEQGIPTCLNLNSKKSLKVNYIQGVARIPKDFSYVETVEVNESSIVLHDKNGLCVDIPVHTSFIHTGIIE